MAVIVIGGHTRNIGKTSVVCALISSLRGRSFTAIKITQFGHGICSANGKPCHCETADHSLAITEERDPTTGTDTSRYLAAGATRSLWVRTRQGELAEAMPRIRREIASSADTIIESNSILKFLQPDFYASVLSPVVADFKPSALRYLDRADAVLYTDDPAESPAWVGISLNLVARIPALRLSQETFSSPVLEELVTEKLRNVGK